MSRSKRRERAGNCAKVGAVKMLNNLTVTTLMAGDGRLVGKTIWEMAKRRRSGFGRGDERGEEEQQPCRRLDRFLAAGGCSSNPA
jgi:hypothetical protein